jgi:transcription elongation factor Elf1
VCGVAKKKMRIKRLVSQYRRDFAALMECEFCGYQKMNNSGYDDRYYHDNVIPNMRCDKCGESTISKGGEIERRATRYPEDYQI